jgi:hypothetical protein
MPEPVVKEKSKAAVVSCEYATKHADENVGKTWSYLLTPHDAIDGCRSLQGLAAAHTVTMSELADKTAVS